MAVTYSATVVGTFKSIVSNSLVSAASTASEAITVVHRLGSSPHEVRVQLRSVVGAGSAAPVFNVTSWNASQATVNMTGAPNLGAVAAYVDIICDFYHSVTQ